MAEVADVAEAAAAEDEDVWAEEAEERLAVVAVCAPVTEPVVDDDEAAAPLLEAADDVPAQEATVGTATPTLIYSDSNVVVYVSLCI